MKQILWILSILGVLFSKPSIADDEAETKGTVKVKVAGTVTATEIQVLSFGRVRIPASGAEQCDVYIDTDGVVTAKSCLIQDGGYKRGKWVLRGEPGQLFNIIIPENKDGVRLSDGIYVHGQYDLAPMVNHFYVAALDKFEGEAGEGYIFGIMPESGELIFGVGGKLQVYHDPEVPILPGLFTGTYTVQISYN